MSELFSGIVCWKPERIGEVINKEALSINRADFLATHVPMRQIAYERAPYAMTSTSEGDLLAEIHRQADEDQHTFVIIKGMHGTGKSHLIRWLKERYAAERPNDAVLLIERANTSLRGTLQQIIDSGLFDAANLPNALKRLQDAITELSADALADNLLDQIKTATQEVDYELPNRLKRQKVYTFLLDLQIRQQLKAAGGPIERVVKFLTEGREDNAGIEVIPGFEASDFEYKPDMLRQVRGYEDAKQVADSLQYKPELRETLAQYLNHLLRGYAISRATRLSAQDLRQMFNDLRRHLQQRGSQLALFIEDITPLIGIEQGMLDVLITQHRGEGNRGFCRLTSVIGVTDGYFEDMRDNIKDRVTHQLTLSSTARAGSDIMQGSTARAEFAGRYLNAMRLERAELEQWVRSGASPDNLKNACDGCPFRTPCHEAFGTIDIGSNGETRQIGLYPFNQQALDTLYRNLREGYPRTPRTFLVYLIGHILQSHSQSIPTADFPPPETEFVSAVQPPTFNPAPHRQLVERQGGAAAPRLMTLLLFWGNRNAERTGEQVGGLPENVFRAFRLRPIQGAASEAVIPPIVAPAEETPLPPPPAPDEDRYTRLIDDWLATPTGHLSNYDKFAEWMADFTRAFIDWQAHGISLQQVNDYVKQGYFYIDGQTGRAQRADYLRFERSSEMRYVLQALADLNTNRRGLTPAQYGEHLATLSTWIRAEEPRIVAFVREPSKLAVPPDYLLNILARNVVLIACLAGELQPVNNLTDLYHQVIASCANNQVWDERMAAMTETHPAEWLGLMRKVSQHNGVTLCRTALLQLLNRPQGRSDTVRYVDAVALLAILKQFEEDDWILPELDLIPSTNDPTWTAALHVYKTLRSSFVGAVEGSRAKLTAQHSTVMSALGEEKPADMLNSLQSALDGLRRVGITTYSPRLDEPFSKEKGVPRWTPKYFETLLANGQAARQLETLRDWGLFASSPEYAAEVRMLANCNELFALFEKELSAKSSLLEKRIDELATKAEAAQSYQRTTALYDELTTRMNQLTQEPHD